VCTGDPLHGVFAAKSARGSSTKAGKGQLAAASTRHHITIRRWGETARRGLEVRSQTTDGRVGKSPLIISKSAIALCPKLYALSEGYAEKKGKQGLVDIGPDPIAKEIVERQGQS